MATPGFGQLVDYVGRKRVAPKTQIVSISPEGIQRVLCGEVLCETNCFSLDTAAAEMNMTAMQNPRCKDAVYHFILSWQQDEDPTPDAIFASVRYSLQSLGMKEHQYVAAIHRDTDNVHCHISANRVHPTTFRAQNMWNDADTLQKCCRVLERDLGFKVDNGSWHMDEYGDLHRTHHDMPSAPRGAARRGSFLTARACMATPSGKSVKVSVWLVSRAVLTGHGYINCSTHAVSVCVNSTAALPFMICLIPTG